MNGILERASLDVHVVEKEVRAATTFGHIESLFRRLFGIISPTTPDGYKNDGSDYGLKVRGKKAREKINAQCKEILARVSEPAALTLEEQAILRQYSGRGGLTENSQYEYYTPTPSRKECGTRSRPTALKTAMSLTRAVVPGCSPARNLPA